MSVFSPKTPGAVAAYGTLLSLLRRPWFEESPEDTVQDAATNLIKIVLNASTMDGVRISEIEQDVLGIGKGTLPIVVYQKLVEAIKPLCDDFADWVANGSSSSATKRGRETAPKIVYSSGVLEEEGEANEEDDNEDVKEAPLGEDLPSRGLMLKILTAFPELDNVAKVDTAKEYVSNISKILGNEDLTDEACADALMAYFNYQHSEFIEEIVDRRWDLYFGEFQGGAEEDRKKLKQMWRQKLIQAGRLVVGSDGVDLDKMAFAEGGMLMPKDMKTRLPPGSKQTKMQGYQHIEIPPPDRSTLNDAERLVELRDLPPWAHEAFPRLNGGKFNRMQSMCFQSAFHTVDNLLCCAPTGGGKTNIAMLTILSVVKEYIRDVETREVNTSDFKVVYIAPMKALVQEVVREFRERLRHLGIHVDELSGDKNLSRHQVEATQVIVTTPEKWNVVTSKVADGDTSYTHKVRLVIVDEVHLLHNERGGVLETVVSRILRTIEQRGEFVRIVGLSATLPNFRDVATFLRVPDKCVFEFDSRYRPVPLTQFYIGVTEQRPARRDALMNEVMYKKVSEQVAKQSLLIFVHSRKETAKLGKWIARIATERDHAERICSDTDSTRTYLKNQSDLAQNRDLKELLLCGIGIHHAGLSREDRDRVETLYRDRKINLLLSTSTLAWGVNLPAHTVIIRGTKVYQEGEWKLLSGLDVMQMFGRAGRPGLDTNGEAMIITTQEEMPYYLTLLNQQLPIESQLMSRIVDFINAEVVNGSITSVGDAVEWLAYTYWFVRSKRNPRLYKAPLESDAELEAHRGNVVRAAFQILEDNGLIKFNHAVKLVTPTPLGRAASFHAVSYKSIVLYNKHLKPSMNYIDLFRLFSESSEFAAMYVRMDEKAEIASLINTVPIPVREAEDNKSAKVNVLLQAYISQMSLEGFCLLSDMTQVSQSAVRILRALHAIALTREWAASAEALLDLARMAERRMWLSQLPLRQLDCSTVPLKTLRYMENRNAPWDYFREMTLDQLETNVCDSNRAEAKEVHRLIRLIPRLVIHVEYRPLTRSLLRLDVTLTPDFDYDRQIHGEVGESFLILVTDVDNQYVLYSEPFLLKRTYHNEDHSVVLFVPIIEPLPPMYYVKVLSERWIGADTCVPIVLRNLILPKAFPPWSTLQDVTVDVADVIPERYRAVFPFDTFSSMQTQLGPLLLMQQESLLISSPSGSGKDVCAEIAIVRMLSNSNEQQHRTALYLAPTAEDCAAQYMKWRKTFENDGGVVLLTGDVKKDRDMLSGSRPCLIMATPSDWDSISIQWRKKKTAPLVMGIRLIILDKLHAVGGRYGPAYEWAVARMRSIANVIGDGEGVPVRFIGMCASVGNAVDLGDWLGIPSQHVFHFPLAARLHPMDAIVHPQHSPGYHDRVLCTWRPTYHILRDGSLKFDGALNSIVFVPSRRYAIALMRALVDSLKAEGDKRTFRRCTEEQIEVPARDIGDDLVAIALKFGIALWHEGLSRGSRRTLEDLFAVSSAVSVLICPVTLCRELTCYADVVIVCSTQHPETPNMITPRDLEQDEMLSIMSRCDASVDSQCHVFTHAPRADFWYRVLTKPVCVESLLDFDLHDLINRDIACQNVTSLQGFMNALTNTYYYRRLTSNPFFYQSSGESDADRSETLSTLVDNVIKDLQESQLVRLDDADTGELQPTQLCPVSAYHKVQYTTLDEFNKLSNKASTKAILGSIASAAEFNDVPVRFNEDFDLSKLLKHAKLSFPGGEDPTMTCSDPHGKTYILLQCYIDRKSLPTQELASDMLNIVPVALRLCHCLVDAAFVHEWWETMQAAMEMCQTLVQCLWQGKDAKRGSQLMQVPGWSTTEAERVAKELKIDTIYQLQEELARGNKTLRLCEGPDQVNFLKSYPNLSLKVISAGIGPSVQSIEVVITVSRTGPAGEVVCPYYPLSKEEGWWIVVADEELNKPYYCAPSRGRPPWTLPELKLQFSREGVVTESKTIKVYVICDSYVGCDVFEDVILKEN